MKKVAIITFTTGFNYGNRLQNYAVQEIIKGLGYEVETITDDKGKFSKWKRYIRHIVVKAYQCQNFIAIAKLTEWERKVTFDKYNEEYLCLSHYNLFQTKKLKKISNSIDYFVVGSDQVWNPYFIESENYFLTFAPKEKRVAYAVSIGIDDLPKEEKRTYKNLVAEMKAVSVREEQGAEILEDLCGHRPVVLLDPTLMIDRELWLACASRSDVDIEQKYMLVYFLGSISDEQKKFMNAISNKYSYKMIELLNQNDRYNYCLNPDDFLKLIDKAELVLTDSYHGSIFSILFGTDFYVFDRNCEEKMTSRIDTLLSKFRLKDRKITDCSMKGLRAKEFDEAEIQAIIKKEREKTYLFFKNAFH